jgi:hypothetical protein
MQETLCPTFLFETRSAPTLLGATGFLDSLHGESAT